MAGKLSTARTVVDLRKRVARWKRDGRKTAVVPTMGALHEGHLSLVDCALQHADRVVATIFLNPTQFAEGEDLDTYPGSLDTDLAMLRKRKAHLAFVPAVSEMYPAAFSTSVSVKGPAAARLEDRFRPHFFTGVATVVTKLLNQAQCDYAIFGEKDYQQLMTVTQMAQDLDIPTRIIGAETIRETDGLAMSSRNAYLSQEERDLAPRIHETLRQAADSLRDGQAVPGIQRRARASLRKAGFKVDYVEARNAVTLAKPENPAAEPLRLLAAAWLGQTRLIDNIAV
ncbi:MAG: pantoate--beta-alanine ligase [Pseudomonadota bacterium]